jgi:dTDP-4-amino-4,6-dideoxygalactose transaminase
MTDVKMVDLYSQYNRIKDEIDNAINEVINSTAFINGPKVKQFQNELKQYLDVENVITCGNGTDALQVALMALDLKPGDEVICPVFSFIATIEVIALLGLKPVLVDVERDSFNIDAADIKKKITSKTKAIIPVHLFGQCANMQEIMELSHNYGLYIIEDAAQALGAGYLLYDKQQKAGTIGHIGCTSFFPSKNLGTFGDGGAIFTRDDTLAEKIRIIVNHGTKVKYHHSMIGVNSRLDAIHAAILSVKLQYLDQYNQARQEAAQQYDSYLKQYEQLVIPARMHYSTHIFNQYTLRLNGVDRDEFKDHLKSKGIPSMIYYPVPFHLQEAFRYLGYNKGDFPVAEELSDNVISLPMHTELTQKQIEYVVNTIKDYL